METDQGTNATAEYLPEAILTDLIDTVPSLADGQEAVEGLPMTLSSGSWFFVAKTFKAVISRFINGTDHGLTATC